MSDIFNTQLWKNKVAELKQKATEFLNVLARIKASEPDTAELQARRATLIARGDMIKNAIQKTTRAIDMAYSFFKNAGDSGQLNNLGALSAVPVLVPIAIITASIASIGYFLTEGYKYLKEYETIEQLKAEGLGTEQAYHIVKNANNTLLKAIPWVLGGVLLTVAYKRVR